VLVLFPAAEAFEKAVSTNFKQDGTELAEEPGEESLTG